MIPVAIVGGGIAGLSAAYYLSKAGIASTLIESRPQLGGVIRTDCVDGCLLEAGPDSFLASKPWALDLIQDVGLASEVIGSNDHQRVTYILRGGRLTPLPDGLMMMAPTKIGPMISTRLLSWPAKIRMGFEVLRRPPREPLPERSVAEFVRQHYGSEAVEYLAEPLLAGVYGGDPEQLSADSVLTRFVDIETKYGSVSRGLLASRKAASPRQQGQPESIFKTLKGGLGSLVSAMVEQVRDHVSFVTGSAESLERTEAGFRLAVNGQALECRELVLACPGYSAARVVEGLDGTVAALLRSIPYNSSTTVALGYDRASITKPLPGFGFLVPQSERERLVACTVMGAKFNHRVPEGRVMLRCFLKTGPQESDEAIAAAARAEIQRILAISAEPLFTRVARWPDSMAQYTIGHAGRVAEIEQRIAAQPGLQVAGNAYHGIGVPDCVRMGKEAAAAIVKRQ